MSDSQFLYQLMLRVNELRAGGKSVGVHEILKSIAALIQTIENGGIESADVENLRTAALGVAANALRLAIERIGHEQ